MELMYRNIRSSTNKILLNNMHQSTSSDLSNLEMHVSGERVSVF